MTFAKHSGVPPRPPFERRSMVTYAVPLRTVARPLRLMTTCPTNSDQPSAWSAPPRGVDGHRAEVAVRDDECGVSVGGFDGRGVSGRVDVAEDDVAIRPGEDSI